MKSIEEIMDDRWRMNMTRSVNGDRNGGANGMYECVESIGVDPILLDLSLEHEKNASTAGTCNDRVIEYV